MKEAGIVCVLPFEPQTQTQHSNFTVFPSFLWGNIQPDYHLSQHKRTKLLFIASCTNSSFLAAFPTPDRDSAFKRHLSSHFYGGRGNIQPNNHYRYTKDRSYHCLYLSYQLFKPQTENQPSNNILFPHFYGAECGVRRAGQHKGGELCDW